MKITGETIIAAPQETVWKALNDPEVLREAIPGAESLEKVGDNQFKAVVTTRIGPITAKFDGAVELSDLDPPNAYTLSGSGSAGGMGNAKGAARVRLEPAPEGTRLSYDVDAEVTGKIAQLGGRLIESTAGVLAGQFFKRFGEIVAPTEKATAGGPSPMVWIIIGVGALAAAAIAALFIVV